MKSVRPKKFLGQHFLKDLNTARAIADTVDACPDLPVLDEAVAVDTPPGEGISVRALLPHLPHHLIYQFVHLGHLMCRLVCFLCGFLKLDRVLLIRPKLQRL